MPVKELYDWRGNKIEVGDVILYAVKHSTSVEINEAVVRGFGEHTTWRDDPETSIQVEWIRSSEGEYSAKWRKVKLVTILNIESVTMIAKGPVKKGYVTWLGLSELSAVCRALVPSEVLRRVLR